MKPNADRNGLAAQEVLCAFAHDTRRSLERSASDFGQLISGHIGRQLDLLASKRYAAWFHDQGAAVGFDQATALAAVAGSDVTRPSRTCETGRAEFGLTADRVRALRDAGELRYGRSFVSFGALEDLYMHAEAGRHYTFGELLRRGAGVPGWDRIAREASDAIVGHDSFNAGFGANRLKPFLAARHGGVAGDYDYPRSLTPTGFLVQVLDRLDACDAATMVRYVTEGVADRNEPIATAIRAGIIDNSAFLREAHELIREEARSAMQPPAFAAFLRFPGLRDFVRQLDRVGALVVALEPSTPPPGDGCYHLRLGIRRLRLDTIGAVRANLAPALDYFGSLSTATGPSSI